MWLHTSGSTILQSRLETAGQIYVLQSMEDLGIDIENLPQNHNTFSIIDHRSIHSICNLITKGSTLVSLFD